MQLRYRFEPGHEDDGVSALVPLQVLNQLPDESFEWLVPGLLDEKIEALVRSLPKNLRVHFVPVPDAVSKALPLLDRGRGSLHAQLANALWRTGGVEVPRDSFREDLLPPHLRMNFLLLDDADKVIARSRSLGGLRTRHARASQQEYAKQSQLTTGARSWVFGDLAERQEAEQGGRRQIGYTALVDEGATVGLRAFATPPEARMGHERGIARLIRLVQARDLKPLRRDLAVNVQGEMVYKGLAAHPLLNPDLVAGRDLRDDLLDRIVMTVFIEGQETIRTEAAFDARIAARRGGIGLAGAGNLAQHAIDPGTTGAHPDPASESRAARGCRHSRAAGMADARRFPAHHAVGATEGIPALPAGHRTAPRKGQCESTARRAARRGDSAARGSLPRARQGRARPETAGRRRVPLAAGGIPRVPVCPAVRHPHPGFRAAPRRGVGRKAAVAARHDSPRQVRSPYSRTMFSRCWRRIG